MRKFVRNLALLSLTGVVLAACGGGGGGSGESVAVTPPTPPTVTPPATFQSQFGATFAAFFNASPDSEPRDPGAGDVPALNLQGTPLDNN